MSITMEAVPSLDDVLANTRHYLGLVLAKEALSPLGNSFCSLLVSQLSQHSLPPLKPLSEEDSMQIALETCYSPVVVHEYWTSPGAPLPSLALEPEVIAPEVIKMEDAEVVEIVDAGELDGIEFHEISELPVDAQLDDDQLQMFQVPLESGYDFSDSQIVAQINNTAPPQETLIHPYISKLSYTRPPTVNIRPVTSTVTSEVTPDVITLDTSQLDAVTGEMKVEEDDDDDDNYDVLDDDDSCDYVPGSEEAHFGLGRRKNSGVGRKKGGLSQSPVTDKTGGAVDEVQQDMSVDNALVHNGIVCEDDVVMNSSDVRFEQNIILHSDISCDDDNITISNDIVTCEDNVNGVDLPPALSHDCLGGLKGSEQDGGCPVQDKLSGGSDAEYEDDDYSSPDDGASTEDDDAEKRGTWKKKRAQREKECKDFFLPNGASLKKKNQVLHILLKFKDEWNDKGRTPLHEAVYHKSLSAVKYLVSNDVDIEAEDDDGHRPLHYACRWDLVDICQYLIESGCDVNGSGDWGYSLHFGRNNVDIIRMLVEAGANLLAENYDYEDGDDSDGDDDDDGENRKEIPLYTILENTESANVVHYLVKHGGADTNHKDGMGDPLLFAAVRHSRGHYHILRVYIRYQCDVNITDGYGRTALHLDDAHSFPSIRGVLMVINAGFVLNATTMEAKSVLHHLVSFVDNHLSDDSDDLWSFPIKFVQVMIPLLHAAGLDFHLSDKGNKTAYDHLINITPHVNKKSRHQDTVALMDVAMVSVPSLQHMCRIVIRHALSSGAKVEPPSSSVLHPVTRSEPQALPPSNSAVYPSTRNVKLDDLPRSMLYPGELTDKVEALSLPPVLRDYLLLHEYVKMDYS